MCSVRHPGSGFSAKEPYRHKSQAKTAKERRKAQLDELDRLDFERWGQTEKEDDLGEI